MDLIFDLDLHCMGVIILKPDLRYKTVSKLRINVDSTATSTKTNWQIGKNKATSRTFALACNSWGVVGISNQTILSLNLEVCKIPDKNAICYT